MRPYTDRLYQKWTLILSTVLLLTALISLPMLGINSTQAQTIISVTTTNDDISAGDGVCSLREAIIAANTDTPSGDLGGECPAGAGADVIELPAGLYQLTRGDTGDEDAADTGDLDISGDLVIRAAAGAGPRSVIIDASSITDRVIHVLSGTVTISAITIRGGSAPQLGGGLYNQADLRLVDVTVTGNRAETAGGGVFNDGGASLFLERTTFSDNETGSLGGGVANKGGAVDILNSTLSGNTAQNQGGGIWNSGSINLVFSTVAANFAAKGGGFAAPSGTLTTADSIVAGNMANTIAATDCLGDVLLANDHNLFGQGSSCPASGNLNLDQEQVFSTVLAPLADNGGPTDTHALYPDSPAVNAASVSNTPATDQRGVPRPQLSSPDIGAFELEDPTISVNTIVDHDDGLCNAADCTLREAINAANAQQLVDNTIAFDIPTDPATIFVLSPLPAITTPVVIDGNTQQPQGSVTIDGSEIDSNIYPCADGLVILAGNSVVRGLNITGFECSGIELDVNGSNTVEGNHIYDNNGNGITVISGVNNALLGNDIHDNGGLSIDLGNDGHTDNDTGDLDSGANNVQNYPVLFRSTPLSTTGGIIVEGRIDTLTGEYLIQFFAGAQCSAESQTLIGSTTVIVTESGRGEGEYFRWASTGDSIPVAQGDFISTTATDLNGNTSELSDCVHTQPNNDNWVNAFVLNPLTNGGADFVSHFIDLPGQSRWYKFTIKPGNKIISTLTNLPANYDMTVYKDIGQAYNDLASPADLLRLGAEFAPEAFSPEAFSPEAFSPEAFSPEAFSPEAFSPEAFSPEAFSPEAFSPEAFSPEAFSPEAFSPEAFSPRAFSPEAFSPEAFSPEAFSPEAFSPEAFSSAQTRSLIGISAFQGTAGEGIVVNTWNNTGEYYVRVRGSNGAFNQVQPFQLAVAVQDNECLYVNPISDPSSHNAIAGDYETIILVDSTRMDIAGLLSDDPAASDLVDLSWAVNGVIVDVSTENRVVSANLQADNYTTCPYAKNLVAESIQDIIGAYRELNPRLKYIVLVGNDDVLPFFRYPDQALLGNEQNYLPPVLDYTTSQASLRFGYTLSQDGYGATQELSLKNNKLPIPNLAVGRLVETRADIVTMIDAYLFTGGVVTPQSSLVTGYDFLEDAALAVQEELALGTGAPVDALISSQSASPAQQWDDTTTPPSGSWSGNELRTALRLTEAEGQDIIFLAGHFSASRALAADYSTRLTSAEVAASTVDLTNVIIFSEGCHSGYNIVNEHGVPGVTQEPDWAQTFAAKGATLVAGTGYQYGDTDFIEYGERLYLEFARQLRTGNPGEVVSVGDALVAAKQTYLAETPILRGIHEKTMLQATLFGLPMLGVNMTGTRLMTAPEQTITPAFETASHNPGAALDLQYADHSFPFALSRETEILDYVVVTDPGDTTVEVTYWRGADGVVTNPAEPALPLETRALDCGGAPCPVLRGMGFRGGDYIDEYPVTPFTGTPTTEIRGVHAPFVSDVFFPIQPWSISFYDAIIDPDNGRTRLVFTPAQFRSIATEDSTQDGIMRRFTAMDVRTFYSEYIETTTAADTSGTVWQSSPALAAPPAIVNVNATINGSIVTFNMTVAANPAVGVHEVWITYTDQTNPATESSPGRWLALDLTQSILDSTQWTGTLDIGTSLPENIRYMVHAVNGVGLMASDTNHGAYYIPGIDELQSISTDIVLSTDNPTYGAYGTRHPLQATLTADGQPVANKVIGFAIGPQTRFGVTDASGRATINMQLLGLPAQYQLLASFAGSGAYLPSTTGAPFAIDKQTTQLTLNQIPVTIAPGDDPGIYAELIDITGRRLQEKTVFFVLRGNGGDYSSAAITDYLGRAYLGGTPLPAGVYDVEVFFGGTITLFSSDEFGNPIVNEITQDDASYLQSSDSSPVHSQLPGLTLNSPPVAVDDLDFSTEEDTLLSVPVPGVLDNDFDPDFQVLTVTLVPDSGPSHGLLTLNADGSFEYTPAANYHGPDGYGYQVTDELGASAQASVAITIVPINDTPVAMDDSYVIDEDMPLFVPAPGVLGSPDEPGADADIDGDPLVVNLLSGPTHGALILNADGSFEYVAENNYYGSDSFTYEACDPDRLCDEAAVNLDIRSINDQPIATGESYTTDENVALIVDPPGVLMGDWDVEDGTNLTASTDRYPDNGNLELFQDGSFIYTPHPDYYGPDSFSYVACDVESLCSTPVEVLIDVRYVPNCNAVVSEPLTIWPLNKDWTRIFLTDEEDELVAFNVSAIYQDEEVGNNNNSPDGRIESGVAEVRAEREGRGDGRVYHIFFTATDTDGATCRGLVTVPTVPHSQSGDKDAIDGGACYNSLNGLLWSEDPAYPSDFASHAQYPKNAYISQ